MNPTFIAIAVLAVAAALVIFKMVIERPVFGVYLYIFLSSILISQNLPVVREKLAGCDFVMLFVLSTILLRPAVWQAGLARLTGRQSAALLAGCVYLLVCGTSFVVNVILGDIVISRSAVELATYCYGFLACIAIVVLVDDWQKWLKCVYAWCGGVAIVAAVSVMATFIYAPAWAKDDFSGRISSTLRESNQVASYCGPMLPMIIYLSAGSVAPKWLRTLLYLTIVPTMIAILATGSRTALVILAVSLVGAFGIRWMTSGRVRLNSLAFNLVILVAIGGLGKFVFDVATDTSEQYRLGETSPFERGIRMFSEMGRGERGIDETRVRQMRLLTRYFPNHPLFGAGPANYSIRYAVHEMHNSYLGALAETGLAGFGAICLWVFAVWNAGWRGLKLSRNTDQQLLIFVYLFGFFLLLLYQMTMFGIRQRPWWFAAGMMICLAGSVVSRAAPREPQDDARPDDFHPPETPEPKLAYHVSEYGRDLT